MVTLANSEDQDEMPHNVAFDQSVHCLLRKKQSSEKYIYFVNKTCYLSIYTMNHPNIIVSNLIESSIGLKRVEPLIHNTREPNIDEIKQFTTLVS